MLGLVGKVEFSFWLYSNRDGAFFDEEARNLIIAAGGYPRCALSTDRKMGEDNTVQTRKKHNMWPMRNDVRVLLQVATRFYVEYAKSLAETPEHEYLPKLFQKMISLCVIEKVFW